MLQLMRDKAKSWVTFIVVGIIAFMMAITGLETLAPNPNNPEVASVNGKEITQAELAQSVDQQRRALIQQMGDQLDPSLLDDTVMNETVLNSLIERQLLIQDAEDSNMEVGTAALDQIIVAMPQFQQDGRFNQDRFPDDGAQLWPDTSAIPREPASECPVTATECRCCQH